MKNLKEKVAFVTGGASGIGFGIVKAFLDEGVRVMVADLRTDHLDEAREALGPRDDVDFVRVDVIDRGAMERAARDVISRFGACHILVNNAGVGTAPRVEEMRYEDWDWVMSVNLGGTVNGLIAFLPHILRQGEGGHIVSTASMAGLLPTVDNFIYAASKYAIRGLSDSLRLSLASRKVGVSVLYPGLTRSRMLQAEKNRQARFGEAAANTPPPGPVVPPADAGMDPYDVGRAVVAGIRANRGYILSHAEFRDELAAHFSEILSGFPADQDIDPGRLMLEEMRRKQTEAACQALAAMTDDI